MHLRCHVAVLVALALAGCVADGADDAPEVAGNPGAPEEPDAPASGEPGDAPDDGSGPDMDAPGNATAPAPPVVGTCTLDVTGASATGSLTPDVAGTSLDETWTAVCPFAEAAPDADPADFALAVVEGEWTDPGAGGMALTSLMVKSDACTLDVANVDRLANGEPVGCHLGWDTEGEEPFRVVVDADVLAAHAGENLRTVLYYHGVAVDARATVHVSFFRSATDVPAAYTAFT